MRLLRAKWPPIFVSLKPANDTLVTSSLSTYVENFRLLLVRFFAQPFDWEKCCLRSQRGQHVRHRRFNRSLNWRRKVQYITKLADEFVDTSTLLSCHSTQRNTSISGQWAYYVFEVYSLIICICRVWFSQSSQINNNNCCLDLTLITQQDKRSTVKVKV